YFYLPQPAVTDLYTLSLHDALPILSIELRRYFRPGGRGGQVRDNLPAPEGLRALHEGRLEEREQAADHRIRSVGARHANHVRERSEEHTSELQSRENLVCRLLLEKK